MQKNLRDRIFEVISMPNEGSKFYSSLGLVLISVAIFLGACLQAVNSGFVSDDTAYILNNVKLAGLRYLDLWKLFVEPYNPMEFLPLRDFSYWMDIALFGINPIAFRIHNIILYLIGCFIVYGVTFSLWKVFRPNDIESAAWFAAIVAAMYSIHPAHVEAVVWISGRKDLLSGAFSLLAIWFAIAARKGKGLSHFYAVAALVAFVAAMLSKATAVVTAPIIAILWILFWRDLPPSLRRRKQLLWPFALVILAICFAVIFNSSSSVRAPYYWGVEIVERALVIIGWMVRIGLSPEEHHFYYQILEDDWLPIMAAIGLGVLLAAMGGLVMLFKRRSLIGFALVMLILLCMPYIQLIPYKTHSLVSDRFLFIAIWPICILIVALSWRLKPIPRGVILLIIFLPWLYQTIDRPRDWDSLESLADKDLKSYPNYYVPIRIKAITVQLADGDYLDASQTVKKIDIPEVRKILESEIKSAYVVEVITPSQGQPSAAVAQLLEFAKDLKDIPEEAKWNPPMRWVFDGSESALANLWWRLTFSFKNDISVNYYAGSWLLSVNKYKDAIPYFRMLDSSSHLPDGMRGRVLKEFGIALLNTGNIKDAEIKLLGAIDQPKPDLEAYCSLAQLYKLTGRSEAASHAENECRNYVSMTN